MSKAVFLVGFALEELLLWDALVHHQVAKASLHVAPLLLDHLQPSKQFSLPELVELNEEEVDGIVEPFDQFSPCEGTLVQLYEWNLLRTVFVVRGDGAGRARLEEVIKLEALNRGQPDQVSFKSGVAGCELARNGRHGLRAKYLAQVSDQ